MDFRNLARVAIIGLSLLAATVAVTAEETALWLRYPAISPDGQTIVFSYRGDLMENKHLDPDYEVDNDPELEALGRYQQLEEAVEILLTELDG